MPSLILISLDSCSGGTTLHLTRATSKSDGRCPTSQIVASFGGFAAKTGNKKYTSGAAQPPPNPHLGDFDVALTLDARSPSSYNKHQRLRVCVVQCAIA